MGAHAEGGGGGSGGGGGGEGCLCVCAYQCARMFECAYPRMSAHGASTAMTVYACGGMLASLFRSILRNVV